MSDYNIKYNFGNNSLIITYLGAPVIGLYDYDFTIKKGEFNQVNSITSAKNGEYTFNRQLIAGSTVFVNVNEEGDNLYLSEKIEI